MVVRVVTGNQAVAWAVKLAGVKVVAAYPITPQTVIVETISEFIENGEMDAKIIRVESEHSALAAVYGAALAGVRSFTATSSHGLFYMYEMVWWVAASRTPLVMAVVTRAIGPPWNIWDEHTDIMAQRDSGWIIGMAEDEQEAFDMTIMGFKISEDERVFLPYMVGLDGFILSHTSAPVDMPEEERVREFLGEYKCPYTMDPEYKITMGNIPRAEAFLEMRYDMWKSINEARKVIQEVESEYYNVSGRKYPGLVEKYKVDDADYVIVLMGAWAGDAKDAVDVLREQGYRVGVMRIRYIRPFPEEVYDLVGKKGVIVYDRSVSMGSYGPLFLDVAARVGGRTIVKNYLAGIGGVDYGYYEFIRDVKKFVEEIEEKGSVEQVVEWVRP